MSRAILILGMHRSGTSSLAGVLQEAGAYLGNVSEQNLHNRKGNRENLRIMDLHESLLKQNGGAWDNPPASVVWSDRLRKERDEIVKLLACAPVWGFKDPRSLLVLDGWLEVLPEVSFAGTFRHPSLVARSLFKRNHFPPQKSFSLWCAYNSRLLRYQQQFGFPLISFDLAGRVYQAKLKELIKILGLRSENSASAFYDDTLRGDVDSSDDGVPDDVIELYKKLERSAL